MTYRIIGPLDLPILQKSINEIINRHESLRTTFPAKDGIPLQEIKEHLTLPLSVIDFPEAPESEKESQIRSRAVEEGNNPFDLSRGPLLRVTIMKLGQKHHILIVVMHHIISDGWSSRIFFHELSELYKAFSQGKPSPLTELPIQYADFTLWQRNWLQGEILESQLSYWKKQLKQSQPILNLPFDFARPAIQTHHGAHTHFTLSKKITMRLMALSRQTDTTLYMTLLAAFNALLYRYTGQDDIIIGSPIANRNRTEIEGLIGFFNNTLVMRTDLSGNIDFLELLQRVKKNALDAYQHPDLPFEKLVEELQPERSLSYTPLFQIMFDFQNFLMDPLELQDFTVERLEIDRMSSKVDFTLTIEETEDGLSGSMVYNTDLFEMDTIERLVKHFQTLLEGIVANPNQRLSECPLLTDAERHLMLIKWNDTKVDFPRDECIHLLFEAQADRTPDAVAVVFGNKQSTYRELNVRANRIGRYLRKLGVGPEGLVGICMERSWDMVVGLLGILKSGVSYVTLDPFFPE